MTPKERAEEVLRNWKSRLTLPYKLTDDDFVAMTESAIVAAIAEEREACAAFLDKQAKGFQVLIDHAPTPIRAEDLKRVKHSIEIVAKQIRARSENQQQQED
jgi:hypothetical protein